MDFARVLIDLAGGVALLLWGVHMVQTGVQRAFGARLSGLLGKALRTRASALVAGLLVTAVLQSSTATGLMVAGFAAAGLVGLVPALAVMLGADIGTTLIVQALSFDMSFLSPALVLAGAAGFNLGQAGRVRDIGRTLIGLGLMLLALHRLVGAVTPYVDSPSLRTLLGMLAAEPLIDLLIGIVLAWAAHSSIAVVLLVMSFASRGVLPLDAAFAVVLGANIGTTINPVLEGAPGDDPAARRVPAGNLLARSAGALAALGLLHWVTPLVGPGNDPARAVANFHTLFNVALAGLLFPVLPIYAALLRRLLPARVVAADPARPLYLDLAAHGTPMVALGAAAREALRLADVLEAMLTGLADGLTHGDRRRLAEARRLDHTLDAITAAIRRYLAGLDRDAMTEADNSREKAILAFAGNLEQAGDVVHRNLLGMAGRSLKQGRPLRPEHVAELTGALERVGINLRNAASLFLNADTRAARLLAEEKQRFRDLENAAMTAHLAALRSGKATEASAIHLDLLRDIRRVNTHLVAAAAYPLLERAGELLPNRLAGTQE